MMLNNGLSKFVERAATMKFMLREHFTSNAMVSMSCEIIILIVPLKSQKHVMNIVIDKSVNRLL